MMFDRKLLIAGGLALLLGLGGGYLFRNDALLGSLEAPGTAPGFELLDLDGQVRGADDWAGKVLVLNFWASWCPPCIKEMPEFVVLQTKYQQQGVQFVGIATEPEQAAREFLQKVPVNYPILLGGLEAVGIAQAYGNSMGALPYTVVIGRDGKIVSRRPGGLSREQTEKLITPLL